ncbi:MAG: ABC transporter permease [Gammaproteobacteria bacterium]|nr:ABC transporter permease [Gammaproteobacteria bacterium]
MSGPWRALIILIVLSGIFTAIAPHFLSFQNLTNITLATATIGILAIGAAFVLGGRGLDLSVGSVIALSGVAAVQFTHWLGLAWPATIVLCLIVGASAGIANGFVVTRMRVPPFIATLGMLGIARGLALSISGGRPIYGLEQPLVWLGQGRLLGIPIPAILFLCLGLIAHLVLTRTRFGTYTLAIGSNHAAAAKAGIRVRRHNLKLYALSGLLAGVAGLVFIGRVNAADPAVGTMYELTAITAAIIGGTNLFGGRASVIGAMLGALIMGVLQNGLNLMAVPSYYQQILIGLILIVAVWLDSISNKEQPNVVGG